VRFDSDVDYIVMELVEGETLADRMAHGPIAHDAAIRTAVEIARALEAAHAQGIVHRDIKPANVMLTATGGAKILDFGLAKFDDELMTPDARQDGDAASFRTADGIVMGTVRYMSPEQAAGHETGMPTDIFSFGILLYEFVTGHHPFAAPTRVKMLHAIVSEEATYPSALQPSIPDSLVRLLPQMLNKNPELRPSAGDVRHTLEDLERQPAIVPAPPRTRKARRIVGREPERAALRAAFNDVRSDRGSMLVVSGDAGIGKTTLVEEFVRDVTAEGVTVGAGRCSERLAGTDAYLPWLEALDALLRCGAGMPARMMRQLAPAWYAKVASGIGESDGGSAGTPPEILKREILAFLKEFATATPTIFTFEDVHWADPSTVDLFAFLSARFDVLPILFVLTCRRSDLLLAHHPFVQLERDLQGRGICRDIALAPLREDDVRAYVDLQFPNNEFAPDFAHLVHAKTDGHPLFMSDILRYLRDRGVIVQQGDRWSLANAVMDIQRDLPESVRALIQRKVDQLSRDERELLLAASVQGHEFDAAILADTLEIEIANVEERLDALERVHAFVRSLGERELPDGRLSRHCAFVHALYQNALYAELGPGKRAALARRIAEALLRGWKGNEPAIATELAFLFETSRDFERAADFFLIAARNARRLFANQEAVDTATRGLHMLESLQAGTDRDRRELELRLTLCVPLMMLRGYSSRESTDNLLRLQELSAAVGATEALFEVRLLFFQVSVTAGHCKKAHELAGELMALARAAGDHTKIMYSYFAMVVVNTHMGRLRNALTLAEEALARPQEPTAPPYLGLYEPATAIDTMAVRLVWVTGYPDRALRRAEANVERARTLDHPETLAFSLGFHAFVHQFRREPQPTLAWAEQAMTLCNQHGLTQTRAWAAPMHGWALAMTGDVDEGVEELSRCIAAHAALQSRLYVSYFHALLADTLRIRGDVDAALTVVDQGLAMAVETSQAFDEIELHRLRGELLIVRGAAHHDEAAHHLRRAIDLARGQDARSYELRASIALARFIREAGRPSEARALLAPIYASFTEGHDTPDLQAASELLASLAT
jgi:predicted ATPase